MKRKYTYILAILAFILVGSCSLLFGPLSRLSIEALANGEWKWEWVGEWSGYLIDFNYPRSIKTYVFRETNKPGFVIYYNYGQSGWYLHIKPEATLEEIMSVSAPTYTPFVNPLHLSIDLQQTNIILSGIDISKTNAGVFTYDTREKKILKERFLYLTVFRAIPLGKTLFFQTNSYSVAKWNIESENLELFQGWGSTPKNIFPVKAEKEENALLLLITNDAFGTNYATFYDQAGNEKTELHMTFTGWVGTNWMGAVGTKGVYMLMSPNYPYNIYHLFAFQNGSWEDIETKNLAGATIDTILGVDIVPCEGTLVIAWLVEPTTILVSFYEEKQKGLTKIAEKRLSIPSDKGSIEGINLFYDRAGHRLFLGVLHAVPPDNHVGVSYFWLPWL